MVRRRDVLIAGGVAVAAAVASGLVFRADSPGTTRRIALFGDSMMEFNSIPGLIAAGTGAEVSACAVGGTTLSTHYDKFYDTFSMPRIADALATREWGDMDAAAIELKRQGDDNTEILAQIKRTAEIGADAAVIWFGTNDFMQGTAIGSADSTTRDTFNGAINLTVQGLRRWQPDLNMVFLTPVFRPRQEPGDGKNSDDFPNKNGLMMSDYAVAMIEAASRLRVQTVDLFHKSGLGKSNSDVTMPDGVHLSGEGQSIVAPLILAAL